MRNFIPFYQSMNSQSLIHHPPNGFHLFQSGRECFYAELVNECSSSPATQL